MVQRGGLAVGQLAFLDLLVDALVLVGEAVIDLLAAGMVSFPARILLVGHCASSEAGCKNRDCHATQNLLSKHCDAPLG